MDTILLDTNIVSFIFKGDSRIIPYEPFLKGKRFAISFMTVAELFQWAAVRKWGIQKINQLETYLHNYAVLPVDTESCRLWGQIRADCQTVGRPISPQDAWIAATALRFDLPLVTHNAADFEPVKGIKKIF